MPASTSPCCLGRLSKIFQKRRASSAPADKSVFSSGASAMPSTLPLWPVSVATLWKLGYFHTFSSWFMYPCPETISLSCGFHTKPQTWDPLSMELMQVPVVTFQKWICRSAVPPPVANNPWFQGHQAMAFTAALCSRKDHRGTSDPWSQTCTTLSLPPDASFPPSDHSNPQTSPSWATSLRTRCSRILTSCKRTSPVRLPLARIGPHQDRAPTLSP
mmetsp:Transcript_28322/g.68012  ORF Transcript_28322/g.68012 Transcript_28322/m.68012 type:complete len:216 (-) Transcript_28322:677-1324(-)